MPSLPEAGATRCIAADPHLPFLRSSSTEPQMRCVWALLPLRMLNAAFYKGGD